MFGGIYDNRFLVKQTETSKKLLAECPLELPYEGSKSPMFLVSEFESADFMKELLEEMIKEIKKMNKFTAYCGLNCETCEARLATVNNDNELRRKVAAEWSKLNQVEILPEMINCEGCRMDGVKTPFCDSLCQIRQCGLSKKFETCGSCGELMSCDKVKMIIENNRGALENLRGVV